MTTKEARPMAIRWGAVLMAATVASTTYARNEVTVDAEVLQKLLERVERLEAQQEANRRAMDERDQVISSLRQELKQPGIDVEVITRSEDDTTPAEALAMVRAAEVPLDEGGDAEPSYFGQFQDGGRGFKVADTPYGDINLSAWSYLRYLNTQLLDDEYTDDFGRTFEVNDRNDMQLNKVMLYFKGWLGDPKLRYNFYVWTSNTNQGLGAQVVVGGGLTYVFDEAFNLSAGISALPGTRSTEGNWPNWLRVDNRPIADEFYRGSFTTGFTAFGKLNEQWSYKAMIGNNKSQLGVDAGQLGDTFDTFAGSLIWTPQGYFNHSFGDFENSPSLSTRFGFRYMHSTEDKENQPGKNDPENAQVRLTDGTLLFRPGAFNTEGQVDEARWQSISLDAAIKYQGMALEGEFFYRELDDFQTTGFVPESEIDDWGYQLQASAMLVPKKWQAYLSGSQIFGDNGDPWDLEVGANWFPFGVRQVRLNAAALYLKESPVGYFSVPYVVGGDGTVLYANAELRF